MPAVETLELNHGDGVTRLTVGTGTGLPETVLADWVRGRSLFVVTSEPVWRLHGAACFEALEAAAQAMHVLEVPDGEAAKSVESATSLWRAMLASGGKRDSRVVTFGGGSVGDVGGFVAGTFLRGVSLAHVPTTLLAQVDAAVGGKAAINLPEAKNPVGVFHHPDHVVAVTDVLGTLPDRQLRAGLAEVAKVAVVLDPLLFARLETDLEGVLEARADELTGLVAAAQRAKVGVVERDPRERGERRVLNFGHTLAHALEADLGYGTLLHGEAVTYGMAFAVALGRGRGLGGADARRIVDLLGRLEPPALPARSVEPLLEYVERDKKARADGPVWVLPTALGAWEPVAVPRDEVAAALAPFLAAPWALE